MNLSLSTAPGIEETVWKVLNSIAVGLGTTVEKLWGIMLIQAQVYGVFWTVWVCIDVVLFITSLVFLKCVTLKYYDNVVESRQFIIIVTQVIITGAFIVTTIAIIAHLYMWLTAIYNPQGWVILEIMDKLGNNGGKR